MVHTYSSAQIWVENVSLASREAVGGRVKAPNLSLEMPCLLEDLSFTVQPGDRVAVVGPSGAGKTSLLRLLNRLSEPTRGTIYLNGRDYRQIPVIQLRQRATLVLQETKLLGMTVQQALGYPLVLRNLPSQEIQKRVNDWRERLHIPAEWLGRTELQISVGQRQLVAIARALVGQPEVLLLDEPTSALDAGRSEALLQTLRELARTQNTTILMVNHQLELAQKFCNRVLYLQQGKLLEDVPAAEVNWDRLRQNLVAAEARQLEEWGE